MSATGRLPCCVAGCGRSTKDLGRFRSWICGRHYPMSSKTTRRRFTKAKAAIRLLLRKVDRTQEDEVRLSRLWRIEGLLWTRIVHAASPPDRPAGIDRILDVIGVR